MVQMRKIRIVSLNITIHPHSREMYVDLFRMAFKLKQSVKLRGSDYGMIGSFKYNPESETITGDIYKFLSIDLSKPWFDSEKLQKAEDEDLEELNIPAKLKPNLETFSYIFYPQGHHLFVTTYSDGNTLGPKQVKRLFDVLLSSTEIVAAYDNVDVTIEPMTESLEQIFKIPYLSRLTIRVTRPNPDDLGDLEEEVFERMDEEHVSKEERVLTGIRGQSIEPSDTTKRLAQVAASNGYVKGHGRGMDNSAIEISTLKHPLIAETVYDADQLGSSVFYKEAEGMWDSIKRRMQKRR